MPVSNMFILPYSSPTTVHATTGEGTPATAKDCAGGAPVTVLNIRMSSDKHVCAVTLCSVCILLTRQMTAGGQPIPRLQQLLLMGQCRELSSVFWHYAQVAAAHALATYKTQRLQCMA